LAPNRDDDGADLDRISEGEPGAVMDCAPQNARISARTCRLCRAQAWRAYLLILEGVPTWAIEDHEMDKLAKCGRCPNLDRPISMELVEHVLRENLKDIMHRIEDMDWDQRDDEIRRIRERARNRRYKRNHREEIRFSDKVRRESKKWLE
jgi:hypothetical protein